MKRLFIKSAVAAAAAFALAGTALAQDKVIKFANQNAVGHPIVQGMETVSYTHLTLPTKRIV